MEGDADPPHVEWVGHGGEHGLSREIVCSLPRAFGCRVCQGEKDCQFIVDRPMGRLVVHKREPVRLVERSRLVPSTGSVSDPTPHPLAQRGMAIGAWLVSVGAFVWLWVVRPPSVDEIVLPLAIKTAMFVGVVLGVPLVRATWRDRGGRPARGNRPQT
jgi:hypothetical protein